MQTKKRNGITTLVTSLIVIIIILIGVAGYAFVYYRPAAVSSSSSAASAIGKLKVGLIEPISPADNSWNFQAHNELEELKAEYGFTLSESDNQASGTTAQPVAQQWASSNYSVIILQGVQYQTMASTIAPTYPHTLFVCVDCTAANYSNVYRIWLDLSGGGFVLGAMAGLLTKTNKFGLIGGGFVPSIWAGHEGFKAGVLYTDPNAGSATFYNKFEAFAWADSSGAETDANLDYTNGADIVFSSGDGIDVGVLASAMSQPTSSQVWATNVYSNLTSVEPADNRVLLGSIVVNYAALYNTALLDYVNNNWQWGFLTANMGSGMIRVQPGPSVPANVKAIGLALQTDIDIGTISLFFKTDPSGNPFCFDNTNSTSCADTTLTVPSSGGTPTGNTALQFNYLPPASTL